MLSLHKHMASSLQIYRAVNTVQEKRLRLFLEMYETNEFTVCAKCMVW